ncbi:hypothetical protein CH063_12751 [Colletotrichum higginsianum]|uniref:Uncharacterized protein n=1 Tax=Colletotrichum higginsianum (strain IMI 349063) TaxID=759273 RepID=H1VRM5_COLHI|nr:hypothetical protein CH063_12751 [Colletotrichum higginsianum]
MMTTTTERWTSLSKKNTPSSRWLLGSRAGQRRAIFSRFGAKTLPFYTRTSSDLEERIMFTAVKQTRRSTERRMLFRKSPRVMPQSLTKSSPMRR